MPIVKPINSYLIFCAVLMLLSGCQVTTNKFDGNRAQTNCEKTTAQLYASLKKKQYGDTYKLYTDSFFSKVDTTTLNNFYRKNEDDSGNITNYVLLKFKSQVSLTDTAAINCVAIYRVTRNKGFTNERINFRILGSSSPKILRYNVDKAQ